MFFLQFQTIFKKYATIFNLRYITAAKMIMASKQEITFNFINGLPSFAVYQFSGITGQQLLAPIYAFLPQ